MSSGMQSIRTWFGAHTFWLVRSWPAWLAIALIAGSLPPAEVQAQTASIEIVAPRQVKAGAQIQISFAVAGVGDVAGYEANLDFDTTAAELDGVIQRRNGALKALGRDIAPLGPVTRANGISFGLYSCPVSNCVDRGSSRHPQGGGGRIQLATIDLAPQKTGQLELHFNGIRVVDASGKLINVGNADQMVRVQVGSSASPVLRAPAASAPVRPHPATAAPGPFDLTSHGVIDHADAVQVALAWTRARQQGSVCGQGIDPVVDVNHDGCVDVSDVELVAANYSGPGQTDSACTFAHAAIRRNRTGECRRRAGGGFGQRRAPGERDRPHRQLHG